MSYARFFVWVAFCHHGPWTPSGVVSISDPSSLLKKILAVLSLVVCAPRVSEIGSYWQ